MERKQLQVEVKDAEKGLVEAVLSTFDTIDHDGDVTLSDAFEDGAPVVMSAYGHSSWMGALPVGKGTIKVTEKDARFVGQFFMDTPHGRDTFATIKGMGALQEYSYGYDVLATGDPKELPEELQKAKRVIAKLQVFEASPVLLGAGIDTRTVSAKQQLELGESEIRTILKDILDGDFGPKKPVDDPAQSKYQREYFRFLRTHARLLGV